MRRRAFGSSSGHEEGALVSREDAVLLALPENHRDDGAKAVEWLDTGTHPAIVLCEAKSAAPIGAQAEDDNLECPAHQSGCPRPHLRRLLEFPSESSEMG